MSFDIEAANQRVFETIKAYRRSPEFLDFLRKLDFTNEQIEMILRGDK